MHRILYIDDEPGLLEIAKRFLEKTNDFSVDIVTSGEDALRSISLQPYNAIISDYQMPGMDGIALLKAVRSRDSTIPFILFTGRGREEVVIEAINNGVDFYLQKGGDPRAQFAELAHKIRQAIARREAENSLNESEKRLADIINFLPDATFAIDNSGHIIAWNRAIEEMTGLSAADMLGKGEYEYAIPFYGKRRPILIDLIFKPEEDISKNYTGISREKDILIAETDLPQPKGVHRTLIGKASPLFNQKGEISGAIESIRDITRLKETELSLQEQNQVLEAMNQFSLELALLPAGENLGPFIVRKLMELTGGVAAWYSEYHPADHTLMISHLESGHDLLEKAVKALGKDPREIKTVVGADEYREMVSCAVKNLPTLTDVSFGQIPPAMSFAIQKVLRIDHFFGLVYVIDGELFATSVLAVGTGKPDPSVRLLESFSHMVAVSLRRRSAEEKLRTGEEKFRTVADFTYSWEYWEAPDHSIIYMSPSCERISGYTREEFQQYPSLLDTLVYPNDRVVWEGHRKLAGETKTVLSLDFRIVRKDGEIRWINHTCHPVFDSGGCHLGRRASNRDITEKKLMDDELRATYEQLSASQEELQAQFEALLQGEKQIRESEEKFRTFMESSIDGVMLIGADGAILAWNPAAEQIFGIPATEALKSNIVDLQIQLIVPEHKNPVFIEGLRSRFAYEFPALFSRNVPLFIEVEVMNANRRRMVVQQALFPIQTSIEKHIGCIVREVTEQRNAEKSLRESEAKYRELAELLPQMVFEMDLGFRVTYANQVALTTMGVTDKDLESEVSALSFLSPSDRDRIRKNIEQILRGETIANHEYTAVRRDGSTFPVMIYAAPFSRFGKPAGFRGILIDITDQKKAENALRESERLLSETQKIALLGGWKANPHTDYLEWTDGIYDIVKAPRSYRPGLAEGMKYYAPEDIPIIRKKLATCLSTGEPFVMEVRIITETGERVWTELRGLAPLIEGTRSSVLGTLQDISGRKLAEEALQESERRFKTLFEQSAEPQLLIDGTGTITDCNAAFLALFALEGKEEILGHSPEDFAPEFQQDGVRSTERSDEIFASVMREGHVQYEWDHQKHDAERTPLQTEVILTLIPITGQPVIHAVIRDITAQKKALDELHNREATLASIFRAAPIGIGLVSNRVLVRVNDRLCEMTGYSPDELVGKSARVLYSSDEEFEWVGREKYDQIRKYGTGSIETRWQRKDGAIRDILLSSTPLDPENHAIGVTFTALDITDRKRAEEALHLRDRAIATSINAIVISDLNGSITYVNDAFTRIWGYTTQEWLGMPVAQLGSTDEEVLKFVTQIKTQGYAVGESVAKRKDGSFFSIQISASLVLNDTGKPVAMLSSFIDITERKRAEIELRDAYEQIAATEEELRGQYEELAGTQAELRKQQQQLEEITSTVPGVVYQFYARPDGTRGLYYVSSRAYEVFGISNETADFFGQFTKQVDPRDRDAFLNSISKVAELRSPWDFEGRFIKPTGETIWFQGISLPVIRGTEVVFSGVLLDITARKHSEALLHESEAKYRTVVEQSQDGIFIAQDGLLIFHNPSFEVMTGYSSAELNGCSIADLITPEDRELVMTRHRERLNGKSLPEVYEFSVLHHDGISRIRVRMLITSTTVGGKTATIGTLHNMTDEQKREDAIREANRKLNLLNSVTRHDVANQLTILQGFTEIAEMKNTDPGIADLLARIEESSRVISRLIGFTSEYQELGIHSPAWFCLDRTVTKAGNSRVSLSDTCANTEILADPMLERVFFNIFDNAARHGERVTSISLRCRQEPDGLVIVIEDNGVGVRQDEKEKIFERGYGKNTGFGLFLVREILAITGLTIRETGVPGEGARFEIRVPKGSYRFTNKSQASTL